MKSQKSIAVRGALALVATGSALALTACGAGQISQTANQVPATNGVFAQMKNAALRDVTVVVSPDKSVSLKFNLANVESKGRPVVLESAMIDGKTVEGTQGKSVQPNCSLMADSQDNLDMQKMGLQEGNCDQYTATSISGLKDVFIGGSKTVEFKLSNSDKPLKVDAPVHGYTPEAGKVHRNHDGELVEQDRYEGSAHGEHGDHGSHEGHEGHSH